MHAQPDLDRGIVQFITPDQIGMHGIVENMTLDGVLDAIYFVLKCLKLSMGEFNSIETMSRCPKRSFGNIHVITLRIVNAGRNISTKLNRDRGSLNNFINSSKTLLKSRNVSDKLWENENP